MSFIVSVDSYGPKFILGILPLVSGFFAGIIVGDIVLGTTIAIMTQLIALGAVPMGGSVPPDFGMIAIIAVILSMTGNIEPTVAIVLSLVAGVLSMYFDIMGRTANIGIVHRIRKLVEEERFDEIDKWHLIGLPVVGVFRG